jgi:hypothetical protein
MKKMVMTATTVLITMGLGTGPVLGAEVTTETEAVVGFKTNATPEAMGRVNPLNPSEVDEKSRVGKTGKPLSIDYASRLDFDMQNISLGDQNYVALPDNFGKESVPNYIQVTDQRGGTDGWQLRVKQNGPLRHASGADLKLTKLVFSKLQLHQLNGTEKQAQTLHNVSVNQNFQAVASVKGIESFGTTLVKLGEVRLHVPGQSQKLVGQYKSSLTYSLVAGPTEEK